MMLLASHPPIFVTLKGEGDWSFRRQIITLYRHFFRAPVHWARAVAAAAPAVVERVRKAL